MCKFLTSSALFLGLVSSSYAFAPVEPTYDGGPNQIPRVATPTYDGGPNQIPRVADATMSIM